MLLTMLNWMKYNIQIHMLRVTFKKLLKTFSFFNIWLWKRATLETGDSLFSLLRSEPAVWNTDKGTKFKTTLSMCYLGFGQAHQSRRSLTTALPSNSLSTKQNLFYLICAAWLIVSPYGGFGDYVQAFVQGISVCFFI